MSQVNRAHVCFVTMYIASCVQQTDHGAYRNAEEDQPCKHDDCAK